jgi:hypothetical protein
VEVEVSVRCHTEAITVTDMASKHPIIHLPVRTHSMVGRCTDQSSGQAGVASRGVEVVVEFLGAAEGSVVGGSNAWGPRWNPWGSTKTFSPKVDPRPPH